MSLNRKKLLTILSKWPFKFPLKEYDYGHRLRELLKSKTEVEELFPGTSADNSRKLDALMRLINNSAKNDYLPTAKIGACGFGRVEIKNCIEQEIKMNEKSSTAAVKQ